VSETSLKIMPSRYPCHCCHKKAAVYWSEKRQSFICENCLKTFDRAVIAKRNGLAVEQLTFC
jgi:transposase